MRCDFIHYKQSICQDRLGTNIGNVEGKAHKTRAVFSRSYLVNGKPLETSQYFSFGGQVATFVTDYLDAPVSLKEILQDMGHAGATLDPVRPKPTNKTTPQKIENNIPEKKQDRQNKKENQTAKTL